MSSANCAQSTWNIITRIFINAHFSHPDEDSGSQAVAGTLLNFQTVLE
jgi:hypothetical protein